MLNLDKNKRYLLACSYGPDSMALFAMLLKEGLDFDVAHVNYHLRKESDDEERDLRSYCKVNRVDIFVQNVDEEIKSNIEARCREIRYSFFAELMAGNRYDSLLVAHNEDDLIETYLMQKTRNNLVNHYGIASETVIKGVRVLRPLLDHSKRQLLLYCDRHNIPYSIDKTNLERNFLRNRFRLDVVSKMSFRDRSSILDEIYQRNSLLKDMKSHILDIDNDIDVLMDLNDVELALYLDMKISEYDSIFKLTHKRVSEIRKIMKSDRPNICLNLNDKIAIKKEYDKLLVVNIDKEEKGFEFVIEKPCLIDNEYFFLDFCGDTSNRNVSKEDYPLTIRTYREGDTYIIKDYPVQVRRLFIDWKMPLSLRKRWPIILNKDNKIIYIPRYREDFFHDSAINFYVK